MDRTTRTPPHDAVNHDRQCAADGVPVDLRSTPPARARDDPRGDGRAGRDGLTRAAHRPTLA
ncbi:hypothetical protein [Prauserella halophila]|uniref:hypothetical protein n=1 Tax=Prauserella halophila TaxID=185641 RepID=UPI0020A26047|nr:hypothetical protein [Prauserella halophila]